MKKTHLSKLFLLLSAGLILAGCNTDTTEAPEETDTVENVQGVEEVSATFEVEIDEETLEELSQEVTVPEGTTVLEVMNENYDIVDAGSGFISSIEGYEQDVDAERYWMFYVNDEMPTVGAADYEIEEGDHIEWRLEDSEF